MFTAFFRSHEGSAPDENVQPYDVPSLPHFARCSALFASLAPYRARLMREASEHGWPLVRPTWLHYPDDEATLDLDEQFMQGSDLLVAPVLHPHRKRVRAYLPAGTWLHAFTRRTTHRQTGGWVELWAPLGSPAAMVRLDEGKAPAELEPFLQAARRAELAGGEPEAASHVTRES